MNVYLASFGPALANHLWQCTAYTVAAWLFTLLLRNNRARVRYAIWLAASIKFLVPSSLLIAAASLLPHSRQPVVPAVYSAVKAVEEPFAAVGPAAVPRSVHIPTLKDRVEAAVPGCLLILWLAGSGVVVFGWWNRWRMVSAGIGDAACATDGRELEILRRLRSGASNDDRRVVPLLLSQERTEPGIFGVFRPVLVWPKELSQRLDDEHIEAIVAHELAHVRRRDNLTAAVHMLVEAVFWFHPFVWWIGREMVKEREWACDEAVAEMGGSGEKYAESLLLTCRFCVESPLPCVAGVTGADLKRRITEMMSGRVLPRMSWPKKALLAAAAVCAVAVPVVLGQAKTAPQAPSAAQAAGSTMMPKDADPDWELATVRPSDPNDTKDMFASHGRQIVIENEPVDAMLVAGYGLQRGQLVNVPDWAKRERWDVTGLANVEGKPDIDQLRAMIRKILAERFGLVTHREQREMQVYALTVAKGGPKITKNTSDPNGVPTEGSREMDGQTTKTCTNASMADLALMMLFYVDHPIVDRTGLQGRYDFRLRWTSDESHAPTDGTAAPGLFTAMQEQLGLKLESVKAPADVLVVDKLERPGAN